MSNPDPVYRVVVSGPLGTVYEGPSYGGAIIVYRSYCTAVGFGEAVTMDRDGDVRRRFDGAMGPRGREVINWD